MPLLLIMVNLITNLFFSFRVSFGDQVKIKRGAETTICNQIQNPWKQLLNPVQHGEWVGSR